jgi:hypothetical protein
VHGEIHLLVTLPDGSRGYLPAAATALWPALESEGVALTLTVDGVQLPLAATDRRDGGHIRPQHAAGCNA